MKKKNYGMWLALLLLSVAALSGCKKENSADKGNPATEAEQTEEPIAEQPEEETTDAVPESTEETEPVTTLTLPILDEMNENVQVGTAGSSLKAVPEAVKLLDWGVGTGLDPEEIRQATVAWLEEKGNDEQTEFREKLELVDQIYQELLGDNAKDLLADAGCEDAAYPWSDAPVESIEAIMEAVGLR